MNDLPPTAAGTLPLAVPGPIPDAVPTEFGRYRIKRRLGAGGMGEVYLAEQDSPAREVALKLIRGGLASADTRQRFKLESEILGRLAHPNVAAVYEAGEWEGRPYFAMEYVAGSTLGVYADGRPLTVPQKLKLFAAICDGVAHAHQRGVIHRDLKPGNVLVGPDDTPKVVDFGVARVTDPERAATVRTDIGQIVGTLGYMAPEQAVGDPARVGPPADVYALGVMLYELLCGELPIDLRNKPIPEALDRILHAEPVPLETRDRQFRGDLATMAAKALQKEPARRYDSAAALAEDVRRHLANEPIVARPTTSWYVARKFVRRNRSLVAAAAVALAALVGGAGLALYGLVQARTETARANGEAAAAKKLLAEQTYLKAQVDRDAGRFRSALDGYTAALALGYPDEVRTRLQMVNCHACLMEVKAARDSISELVSRTDLGDAEPEVLLVAGLIGMESGQLVRGEKPEGAIRTALARGLPPGQEAFARGLLAETVTEMLGHMTRACELDTTLVDAEIYKVVDLLLLGRLRDADRATAALDARYRQMPQVQVLRYIVLLLSGNRAGANAVEAEVRKVQPRLAGVMQLTTRVYASLVSRDGPDYALLMQAMLGAGQLADPTAGNGPSQYDMLNSVGHLPAFRPFAGLRASELPKFVFDNQVKFQYAEALHKVAPSGLTYYILGMAADDRGDVPAAIAAFREADARLEDGVFRMRSVMGLAILIHLRPELDRTHAEKRELLRRLSLFAPLADDPNTLALTWVAVDLNEWSLVEKFQESLRGPRKLTSQVWVASARGEIEKAGALADELYPQVGKSWDAKHAVRNAWAARAAKYGKPEPLLQRPHAAK